jgi:hypothetical protein
MNAIVRDLYSGGESLRGTTADGIFRVTEADLNGMLAAATTSAAGIKVEIQNDNRALVRFGVLHATVLLPPRSDISESPFLTFALGSIAIAWTLKHVLKQSYVQVHGRLITVDLSQVPALSPYRDLLRYVKTIEMATISRELTLRVHAAIG